MPCAEEQQQPAARGAGRGIVGCSRRCSVLVGRLGPKQGKQQQQQQQQQPAPFLLTLLLAQGLGSAGLSPMALALVEGNPAHAQVVQRLAGHIHYFVDAWGRH